MQAAERPCQRLVVAGRASMAREDPRRYMAGWINQGPGVSSARLFMMLTFSLLLDFDAQLAHAGACAQHADLCVASDDFMKRFHFCAEFGFQEMRRDLFHMGLQTSRWCCWIKANSCLRGLHRGGHHFVSIVHGGVRKYCAPYG